MDILVERHKVDMVVVLLVVDIQLGMEVESLFVDIHRMVVV